MTAPRIPAAPLRSARLDLEPLRVEHAAEAAPVFDDDRLHTYMGGRPATEEQLRERYRLQVRGRSPDGSEAWLNWMLRRRDTGQLVGTVQATVRVHDGGPDDGPVAELAWVVGRAHQGSGYAREAAAAMMAALREHGVERFTAHIHPDHQASMGIARALGLTPTGTLVDGEIRWVG